MPAKTPKHSPLPWTLDTMPVPRKPGVVRQVVMAGGYVIAEPHGHDHQGSQAANAALIVRAVNSHDAMVKACRAMAECIREDRNPFASGWGEPGELVRVTDTIKMEVAWTLARAALKLAEGE